MNHPFNLQLEDLELLEFDILPTEEAEITGSRAEVTTLALGEEGGHYPDLLLPPHCRPLPRPPKPPICPPIKPPIYTTMALGEEGGDWLM